MVWYYVGGVAFYALLAAAQSSVLVFARLNSGQPDLILLWTLAWAVHANRSEALFWAFVGGIFHDLLSIAPLGTSVLALLAMIGVVQTLKSELYSFSPLLLLPIVFFGTLLHHLVLYTLLAVVGYGVDFVPTVRYFLLPTLLYHVGLILPVYVAVRVVQRLIGAPSALR